MNTEVNLLSLYKKRTADIIKPATQNAEFAKELAKIGNLITAKSLLIEDIIAAMNNHERISPGSYLKTRFYNRRTRLIDTELPAQFKLNNIIVENISRGTIDEDAKPGVAPSTHYAIPAMMYDLKPSFESLYKLPSGYYIFSHKCFNTGASFPADRIYNHVFHLSQELTFKYSLQEHTLVLPSDSKDKLIRQRNMLHWLGNLNGSGKYCLGDTTRNINAMAIFFGNVFNTDLLGDTVTARFGGNFGFPQLFDEKYQTSQVNSQVIIEDITNTQRDLFLTDTQRKYFETLKTQEFVKVYELNEV